MTATNPHAPVCTSEASPEDQGWTRVRPKPRRSKRHPAVAAFPPQHRASEAFAPRTENLRSVSDITAEYHAVRSQWEPSACCAALRDTVASAAARRISRAMCLGIGSFDPPGGEWDAKRKAYLQLVAFLVMVEELEKSSNAQGKIQCIFQEPIFTENDKAFLASLGHRVVDTPQACDSVDQECFLFGVHLYRPIYAMALRNTTPAMFVGTGWDVWDEVSLSPEPVDDLINLQEMERTYRKLPFPRDTASTTAFSSTSIYLQPKAVTRSG